MRFTICEQKKYSQEFHCLGPSQLSNITDNSVLNSIFTLFRSKSCHSLLTEIKRTDFLFQFSTYTVFFFGVACVNYSGEAVTGTSKTGNLVKLQCAVKSFRILMGGCA